MPDSILAEALEAEANAYARPEATPSELNEAARWVSIACAKALEYILAHRAELEVFELERAARQFCDVRVHCPVQLVEGSDSKPTTGSTQYRGGATLVIVGENWRPEVKR